MMKFPGHFHKHYRVPDDYFSNLEARFSHKRINIRKKIWMAAASFIVIAGMSFSFWQFTHKNDVKPVMHENQMRNQLGTETVNLDDLPEEVIEDYLLMDFDDDSF